MPQGIGYSNQPSMNKSGFPTLPQPPPPPQQPTPDVVPYEGNSFYKDNYSPYDDGGLANTFAQIWSQGLGDWKNPSSYEDTFYEWLMTSNLYGANQNGYSTPPGGIQAMYMDDVASLSHISPQQAAAMPFGRGAVSVQPAAPDNYTPFVQAMQDAGMMTVPGQPTGNSGGGDIAGFISLMNDPTSGLSQIYQSGGPSGVVNWVTNHPHLLDKFGLTPDEVASALLGGEAQGPYANITDPFMQFALSFLYPNGLPGTQEPVRVRRWAGEQDQPQIAPGYQPQPTLGNLLGNITSVDPLLASLLGGYNPQPAPTAPQPTGPFNFNKVLSPGGY